MRRREDGKAAFNARIKHLLEQGLIEDRREVRPDRRPRRSYTVVDMLEIALCLQLQRSHVPPATAVRFVLATRERLDGFWLEGLRGSAPRLYVEVDAFAAIGEADRTGGRGSRGNEVGTISLDRLSHLSAEAMPPPALVIDTVDLQRRVHDQIAFAGARAAAGMATDRTS